MDPLIVKQLEEGEDESMHSGVDVEAFTAALNRDIEGDSSNYRPVRYLCLYALYACFMSYIQLQPFSSTLPFPVPVSRFPSPRGERTGSWLWFRANVTVQDALTQMARNDIGSLVVLYPGDKELISGIITERRMKWMLWGVDYLRKVAALLQREDLPSIQELEKS